MGWIVLLLLYAAGFGILTTLAAKKKNRDQTAWFFIGVLFGVFGVIAALLVEPLDSNEVTESTAPEFDPSALSKKCPACAEVIKLEALLCRYCNTKFAEEEVIGQIAAARAAFEKEQRLMERLH
jgi:hypothetical protein